MIYRIKTKSEVVELSSDQLLQSLMQKVTDCPKPDQQELACKIANFLEVNGVLKTISLTQLITLSFSSGYFYRIFLEKNDVEKLDADNSESNS